MARTGPTGTRVNLTIPHGLAAQVARSAQVAAGMERLVAQIAAEATDRCPVGRESDLRHGRHPGELRDSQQHGVIEGVRGVTGVIAYHAFYAHMVHNGTRRNSPNPWLLNAALAVMTRRTQASGTATHAA